jgi:hypothetical protein
MAPTTACNSNVVVNIALCCTILLLLCNTWYQFERRVRLSLAMRSAFFNRTVMLARNVHTCLRVHMHTNHPSYSATRAENATSNKCPRLDDQDALQQHPTASASAAARARAARPHEPLSSVGDAAPGDSVDSGGGSIHSEGQQQGSRPDHVKNEQPLLGEGCYTDMRLARTPLP